MLRIMFLMVSLPGTIALVNNADIIPTMRTAPYTEIGDAEKYCDSIGCHVPSSVGSVELRQMGLFWGGHRRHLLVTPATTCETVFDLEAAQNSISANTMQHKNLTSIRNRIASQIHAPWFAQVALSPVRRLVFGANRVVSHYDDSASTILRPVLELFSMDHLVFGSYGSWYTTMLLEKQVRTGDRCFVALSELTDFMMSWDQDKAQGLMETIARAIRNFCSGGGFETQDISACVNPRYGVGAIQAARESGRAKKRRHVWQLETKIASWEEFLFGQRQLVSCYVGDSLDARVGMVAQIKRGIQMAPSNFNSGFDIQKRLTLLQQAHFYNKYPRVIFSLCPAESQGGLLYALSGGRFEASVIGATLYEGGTLEAALFIGAGDKDSDSCVLVDGQRTFSSVPVGYFTRWTCETEVTSQHGGLHATVVSQTAAVVSYSSAVAVISCDLPPESGDRSITQPPIVRLIAKRMNWQLDIPLCGALQGAEKEGADDRVSQHTEDTHAMKPPRNRPSACCSYDDYFGPKPFEKIEAKRKITSLGEKEDIQATVKKLQDGRAQERTAPEIYFRQRTMALCSQVLYKLDSLRGRRLVREWIYYHYMIGIRHFVFYDRDGSLKEVLRPFLSDEEEGSSRGWESLVAVQYYPMFSSTHLGRKHHLIHGNLGLPSHAAPDAIAAAHCFWQQRGRSEWVAMLHAPDEYLSNTHGLRHIEEILRPLRELQIDILDVSQIYFVNLTRRSDVLLGRYSNRSNSPLLMPLGWGNALFKNSFLNRFGSPIVRPEAVSELVAAHYPRANNLFFSARILDEVGQNFARANHYGHAFSARDVLAPDDFLVRDYSILWAEEVMSKVDD